MGVGGRRSEPPSVFGEIQAERQRFHTLLQQRQRDQSYLHSQPLSGKQESAYYIQHLPGGQQLHLRRDGQEQRQLELYPHVLPRLPADAHERGVREARPPLPVQQEEATATGGDGGVPGSGAMFEHASTRCDGP